MQRDNLQRGAKLCKGVARTSQNLPHLPAAAGAGGGLAQTEAASCVTPQAGLHCLLRLAVSAHPAGRSPNNLQVVQLFDDILLLTDGHVIYQ